MYTDMGRGADFFRSCLPGVWRYLKLKDVTQMRLTSFAFHDTANRAVK